MEDNSISIHITGDNNHTKLVINSVNSQIISNGEYSNVNNVLSDES